MPTRPPSEASAEIVPGSVIARLFVRASELDAAGGTGATVSELRAAAAEAGISAAAFEAALAEVHGAGQAQLDVSGRRRWGPRAWVLAVGIAALIVAGGYTAARQWAPTGSPPVVEEALLLRCLSPVEAAELVRPLLRLRTNTIVIAPERAPRLLTIRATPEQFREVRSLLDRYEGQGSAACGLTVNP